MCYFIYEENATDYIVFDFINGINIYRGKKKVKTKLKISQGTINSSLSETIDKLGISPRVSIKLSEIYAWTIDFFKIQEGDAFKVYYENNYIDGEYIGIGRILAAEFTHKNQKFYSFYYKENENYGEYFDESGRTLRKAFLKAPLDFYRISSRYSRNRKHPVTGQWKGHFGTDYKRILFLREYSRARKAQALQITKNQDSLAVNKERLFIKISTHNLKSIRKSR